MKTLKLIGLGWMLLVIGIFHVQAEQGKITTDPPYVQPSDKTQPYTTPVGPNSDGTYTVKFIATCDDTTLSVSGTFDDATSFNGAFTLGSPGATKTVTYPTSAQGKLSNVTITVTSSDSSGTCTSSIWRPRYTSQHPLARMCFGGDFLAGLIYNVTSFIPNFNIKALESSLLGANASNITSKQVFMLQVRCLSLDSRNKSNLAIKR